MSEYRSELLAVNERITALQAELVRLGPKQGTGTPRFSVARLLVVLVVALFAAGATWMYCIGALSTVYRARPIEDIAPPPLPADPPRPRTGLLWLTDDSMVGTQGERFLDVDGDGKPEIIGLSWDRAVPDLGQGLHVVALDARTLHPKWTSIAFFGHRGSAPATTEHLVVLPAGLVLSDAHGIVHVLDPASGKQRSETALGFPVDAACPAPDGSARALLAREGIPWSESPGPLQGMMSHEIARIENVLVDPATGKTTHASIHTFCEWSNHCGRRDVHDCRVDTEGMDAPRKTVMDVRADSVFRDGDDRVGVGTINLPSAGDDAVPEQYVAARWSATTRQVAWKTPLSRRDDLLRLYVALGTGTFVVLDDGPSGPAHFRALDATTGAIRFDRRLDHAGIGTRVNALFAHGDCVYVARAERLECYDASSGDLIARSDAP